MHLSKVNIDTIRAMIEGSKIITSVNDQQKNGITS
jgi:hypothetical protein